MWSRVEWRKQKRERRENERLSRRIKLLEPSTKTRLGRWRSKKMVERKPATGGRGKMYVTIEKKKKSTKKSHKSLDSLTHSLHMCAHQPNFGSFCFAMSSVVELPLSRCAKNRRSKKKIFSSFFSLPISSFSPTPAPAHLRRQGKLCVEWRMNSSHRQVPHWASRSTCFSWEKCVHVRNLLQHRSSTPPTCSLKSDGC